MTDISEDLDLKVTNYLGNHLEEVSRLGIIYI